MTLAGPPSPRTHPEFHPFDPELIKFWGRKDKLIIQVPAYQFLEDLEMGAVQMIHSEIIPFETQYISQDHLDLEDPKSFFLGGGT